MLKMLDASFVRREHKEFESIRLSYSVLHIIGGNPLWFCRIWRKDWIKKLPMKQYGESYGKNKFEAYRKALKDLKNENDNTHSPIT